MTPLSAAEETLFGEENKTLSTLTHISLLPSVQRSENQTIHYTFLTSFAEQQRVATKYIIYLIT